MSTNDFSYRLEICSKCKHYNNIWRGSFHACHLGKFLARSTEGRLEVNYSIDHALFEMPQDCPYKLEHVMKETEQ